MNAYEVLGNWGTKDGKPLPKDADSDTIKKAYRRASKKAHPDRNGGDVKAMIAVNVANDILTDPKRRERHDLGHDDAPVTPPLELKARQVLAQAFMTAVMGEAGNYVSAARNILVQISNTSSQNSRGIEAQIKKMEKVIPSVSFDPKDSSEVNVWEDQLISGIANLKDRLELELLTVKACDRARELLIAYKCTATVQTTYTRSAGLEFLTRGF